MIGKNEVGSEAAVLIDFGFVQKYRDSKGVHNPEGIERKNFQGNMMFASIDQMDFKETSRRDDLASLAYMMLYLMNEQNLPGLDSKAMQAIENAGDDALVIFKVIQKIKKSVSMFKMSQMVPTEIKVSSALSGEQK